MNKKVVASLFIFTFLFPTSVYASADTNNKLVNTPTLAILDTAIDNSIPEIKSKLIYEVCIIEWATCPNNGFFMEGKNSATLPVTSLNKSGFGHGTAMASAAIRSNPNMNIVFIRMVGQSRNYERQSVSESSIWMALDWVIQNKDRFNIQAVAVSQGSHNFYNASNYCPKSELVDLKIKTLVDSSVPVFFPTGNSSDYTKIDWPACVPDSIAVGGATKKGIESYSNYDSSLLDFNANAKMELLFPGGVKKIVSGTSISTQVAAAYWLAVKYAKPNLSYNEIYDLLKTTSKSVKGKQGTSIMIDIQGALNV